MSKRRAITQWGPNSLEPEVRATIDDRCPKCEGVVVWDETNGRDECEACGQPITSNLRTPPQYPLFD